MKARPALVLALFAIALLAAGCSWTGGESETDPPTGLAAQPAAADFPAPRGRTLAQLADQEATEGQLVAIAANEVFERGKARIGFGAYELDGSSLPDAEIALYVGRPGGGPAQGPYPAAVEDLGVGGPFTSKAAASDPDAPEKVYVSEVDFPSKGKWRVLALGRKGDSYSGTFLQDAQVGRYPDVPQRGERAPLIDTPTAADVGGDLAQIDTRQPPSTMHDVSFADVVGEKPVVLLFATSALCQSRVCGPVIDIAEEVKSERSDDAAFIHMEIYKDNVLREGNLRPEVEQFGLPTEPWLFVVDERGRVSTAIEGAFSKGELQAAIDRVTRTRQNGSEDPTQ